LLATLRKIADRHDATVSAVAMRYILQKAGVAAAIIGVRHAHHLPDTLRLFGCELDEED